MPRRKKKTPLEQELWDAWEEMASDPRYGFHTGLHRDWSEHRDLHIPLFKRAYVDGSWQVGYFVAATVAGSLLHSHNALGEYAKALEVAEALATHPGPRARHDRAEETARLWLCQLYLGDFRIAPKALEEHLMSGIYTPGSMALQILPWLSAWLEHDDPIKFTPEMRSLAAALAKSRRAPKRAVELAEKLHTKEELFCVLHDTMGWGWDLYKERERRSDAKYWLADVFVE